ncbi:hypothetical protein CROQUDRAFT_665990 [Cronartium quercuum f. sp. fusiforme G11]|uniref:Uncharacterized protein n=1 Tax=Cronartium quercuum f. sp. fusiforme G11 TaxID=708437 RepID=A0A9P6N5P1_9BASI|nr:hypothetical protein CROQUDRAFT_665990 [Cronartium quercuum f. sp. fusiforme G11]
MPHFSHKQVLKRSIYLAQTSRHEILAQQCKWLSLLAPLDVELMAPSLDHSMELLLKGVQKLAEAYTDLEVLEEALRIINWKQYVVVC